MLVVFALILIPQLLNRYLKGLFIFRLFLNCLGLLGEFLTESDDFRFLVINCWFNSLHLILIHPNFLLVAHSISLILYLHVPQSAPLSRYPGHLRLTNVAEPPSKQWSPSNSTQRTGRWNSTLPRTHWIGPSTKPWHHAGTRARYICSETHLCPPSTRLRSENRSNTVKCCDWFLPA